MTNAQDILATRYGKRTGTSKRQRYAFIALGASLLLGFLGWAGFTSVVNSMAPQSEMLGFVVEDAQHSTATISVSSAGFGKATCAIRAQAEDFSIVGYKEVKFTSFPTGPQKIVVNTIQKPVSVSIDRCW